MDAPKQKPRQSVQRAQASPSRAVQRRAETRNRPPPTTAPVPYVTPSTGTIGAPPAPYAGGQ
ncbi:MAG: hypothetical protein E7A86_27180, partial [Bradyrhizobium sp.]|nr:hypothetical protein [Bradyrhizobium sp.]